MVTVRSGTVPCHCAGPPNACRTVKGNFFLTFIFFFLFMLTWQREQEFEIQNCQHSPSPTPNVRVDEGNLRGESMRLVGLNADGPCVYQTVTSRL